MYKNYISRMVNVQYTPIPMNRGVLPSKRLLGMCSWMGSHFHNWVDYNGVIFLVELLEWGRTLQDFWYKKDLVSRDLKIGRFAVKKWLLLLLLNHNDICPKVTEIGSIVGLRIDYNGVGVLRGQRHIPSKT